MAEIKTEGGSLYFYTHWAGRGFPDIARKAVEKARPRLGDHPYWTRIVVDQLIFGCEARDSETGAGLMLAPNAEDSYNGDQPSVIISGFTGAVTVVSRGGKR
jgi:hypothetical protein